MAELSPAAFAVVHAFVCANARKTDPSSNADIAAALRAAADQVVPPDPCGDDCCIDLSIRIRADLLAIAAELEGSNA